VKRSKFTSKEPRPKASEPAESSPASYVLSNVIIGVDPAHEDVPPDGPPDVSSSGTFTSEAYEPPFSGIGDSIRDLNADEMAAGQRIVDAAAILDREQLELLILAMPEWNRMSLSRRADILERAARRIV